jgi:hypothetical protein
MAAETPTPDGHYVKRVVLPSGKTIEVVYFDSDTPGEESYGFAEVAPESVASATHPLHICCECSSELVYPVEWDEAGPECWRVSLRCPNCEWAATGVFPQELVDRFDERLDEGTEQVVADLKKLMHANMSEEIDRFAAALAAGAILPEDF